MLRRGLTALAVLLLAAGGAFAALAYHPAIGKVTVATPDQILVRHGAVLAAIGDCAVCHTAPHGAAYAGGRAIQTPFGTLFSTNITPDDQTGIGGWSLAAFSRAMRQGVSRDGRNLYPALPYTHFTRLTDDDLTSLYAYFMAQPAVFSQPPANQLPFPLNWRPLLAAWNLLFLDNRRFTPDPAHDAEWNRGAYLVDGLAHCGACHTPHNALGAEQTAKALAGGEAEGWHAPALAGANWSTDSLANYLRTGADPHHGAAAGPMAPVWWNLARAPQPEIRAISAFVASLAGPTPPPPPDDPDAANLPGAATFAGACASCHGPAAPMMQQGAASLGYSAAVAADDPGNLLRVLLRGIRPEQYRAGPQMPAFATILTDAQAADVATYLRARFAPGRPPGQAWRKRRILSAAKGTPRDRELRADRQRPIAPRDGSGANPSALRPTQRSRPERRKVRLRPRPVRRVHRQHRGRSGALLHHPRRRRRWTPHHHIESTEPGALPALQAAFVAEQAMQCGYCINGMIMTAKPFLDSGNQVTDPAVREVLAQNLCRCGAHNRIVRAMMRAAGQPVGSGT